MARYMTALPATVPMSASRSRLRMAPASVSDIGRSPSAWCYRRAHCPTRKRLQQEPSASILARIAQRRVLLDVEPLDRGGVEIIVGIRSAGFQIVDLIDV